MAEESRSMQQVWRALANPARRRILDLLREGPRTTGDLAGRLRGLTRFAVMQHLGVLEQAELVIVRREGRERYNYLNPVPIQLVYDRWVAHYVRPWTEALVALRHQLEAEPGEKRRRPATRSKR
jgi:DNA-binding transcriptional ArsR family regulator